VKEVVWVISLAAAGTIAVLFAVHWKRTRDRFFALFSAAFAALAVTYVLQLTVGSGERVWYVYLARLSGFLLIIAAIVDKNRSRVSA